MDWNPDALIGEVRRIVENSGADAEKLQRVCDLLAERVPHYDWVGFYLVNPGTNESCCLGPTPGRRRSTRGSPSAGASAGGPPPKDGPSSSAT